MNLDSNKKTTLQWFLIFFSIMLIVSYAWYGAEIILYGTSQRSDIDTIFTLWFAGWATNRITD